MNEKNRSIVILFVTALLLNISSYILPFDTISNVDAQTSPSYPVIAVSAIAAYGYWFTLEYDVQENEFYMDYHVNMNYKDNIADIENVYILAIVIPTAQIEQIAESDDPDYWETYYNPVASITISWSYGGETNLDGRNIHLIKENTLNVNDELSFMVNIILKGNNFNDKEVLLA
jgi:hypothetical protein